jgi:gamma-glutamyltranspeptidase/glutathione hydrolase
VDPRYVRMAGLRENFLRSGENTGAFLDEGRLPAKGYVLKQPDLALTLERIAREGAAGFYAGPTARSMLQAVNGAGGAWRMQDLSGYRVIERKPVLIEYHGARITAAALPSAGGIALAQCLQMLERFKLADIGEPATDHLVIETLRRAFQDRARYLADPDLVRVPVERLVSPSYARSRAAGIDPQHATASAALGVTEQVKAESHDTTHFSIIDARGNRVAGTQTINLLFGSGIVAPGTGVLLNNEMDDFTLRSDVPNAFKLRGGPANRIEPGKRPLSSMTPAFVEDEKGVLVLGAPGGSRIVSQVLLGILAYVDMRTPDVARIVQMARYHHQFWPDRVEIEPHRFSDAWIAAMAAKGHTIDIAPRAWGNMQAVFQSSATGQAEAASDPRGEDVGWY